MTCHPDERTGLEASRWLAEAISAGQDAYAVHLLDQLNALALDRHDVCWVDAMAECLQRLSAALTQLHQAMQASYATAGQPYGPGDDAMWRWAQEQAAMVAAQERAEHARICQMGLEELRRRHAD